MSNVGTTQLTSEGKCNVERLQRQLGEGQTMSNEGTTQITGQSEGKCKVGRLQRQFGEGQAMSNVGTTQLKGTMKENVKLADYKDNLEKDRPCLTQGQHN